MILGKAASFLQDFLSQTGKRKFTYSDLLDFFFPRKDQYQISYHTIERYMRKLSQHGIIAREKKGKTVMFVVPKYDAVVKLKEWARAYRDARNREDYETVKKYIELVRDTFGVSIKDAVEILNYV